jgi:hypothetical protein
MLPMSMCHIDNLFGIPYKKTQIPSIFKDRLILKHIGPMDVGKLNAFLNINSKAPSLMGWLLENVLSIT